MERKIDSKNPIETLELIDSMIKGYLLHKNIMEDGKINLLDLPLFIGFMPVLYKSFVGIQNIENELAAIDDDGKMAIKAKIREFCIEEDEVLEELIEELTELIFNMVGVITKFVYYLK